MAKTTTGRRIRTWTGRSSRAIPYGLFARVSDWRCAGHDAKKGVPELVLEQARTPNAEPADAGAEPPARAEAPALGTPRMTVLVELGRGRMEAEWIKYKAEVHDELVDLTRARAQRESLDAELALVEQELEHAPPVPTEDELTKRVGGERYTDKEVVRARRLADHAKRRTVTKQQALDIARRIREQDVEIARLGEPIRVRFEVAQTCAAMIDAYVRRRCAAYLSRLIRKHPEGARLNHLLGQSRSALPDWATGVRSPDLEDLPTSTRTRSTPPFVKAVPLPVSPVESEVG
jgi:hypothetical protein